VVENAAETGFGGKAEGEEKEEKEGLRMVHNNN